MLSVESLLGWMPAAGPGAGTSETPEGRRGVARRLIADTLPRMEESRRLVMALYYYEELTVEEIASALGMSVAKVRQIREQAVSMLNREIASRLTGGSPVAERLSGETPVAEPPLSGEGPVAERHQ